VNELFARLQAALGERYALEREIGQGGMATVYLAQDLKHRRLVAIKVLRPELAAVLGPERFLREIEIAAKLQHPHILPLHDSGEEEGLLYYVMPYVEGESLRSRLERERQLPLDEALEIVREVADALSYAHTRDVIHRDIKPENILLSSGHALVADFGIARAITVAGGGRLTQAGITVGTLGYMSPEQAAGVEQLDGRSDIYSLGCVLYELLGGEQPFLGSSPQAILARQSLEPVPRLRTLRDTVPEGVEQAVKRALSRTPADRFATATQFAAALMAKPPASGGRGLRRSRRAAFAVVATVALVALGAAAVLLYPQSSVPFDRRDWILVADFKNATGDPVFDRSLTTALTAEMQQSRYVNVFPRSRVRQTLERMRRPGADSVLDEALANEVAQREGIRVVVAGEVGRIDSAYVIATRIVDPSTAAALKVETVRARGREQVLEALDGLARKLRRDLGESLLSARQGLPLPRATTASLDALKKFADGQRAFDGGAWREAKELWLAALALDSNFAMAHAALGGLFYWNNDRPNGEAQFTKALSVLERLTDRERSYIRAQAAGWRGDRAEATSILKTLLLQYPDDRRAWFNLGYNYLRWGRCRDALDAYTKLLAIDSLDPDTYVNIATCHNQLGEYAQALAGYQKAFGLRPDLITWENINHEFGGMYVVTGRFDDARGTFEKMLVGTANQQARGHRSLALLEMFRGRYGAAIPHLREAILLNQGQKAAVSEARNRMFLAVAFQARGKMDPFRAELNEVYGIFKRAYLEPRLLLFAGKLYARSGDVRRSSEILDTLAHRVNENSPSDRADALLLKGEIALAKGKPADAVSLFESASALVESNYHRESLAYALAERGDLDEAVRRYQELTRRAEFGWEAQEYWLLANYRLGQLYETKGDTVEAIRSYSAFLDIWKDADENLPDLIDARNRLRRLRVAQRVG